MVLAEIESTYKPNPSNWYYFVISQKENGEVYKTHSWAADDDRNKFHKAMEVLIDSAHHKEMIT